ncbi:MAG: TIM barrel protein [Defluviitaleaceae bacterium]|nr:TIM barrel protein [Defluviitaleaceae bacterium]
MLKLGLVSVTFRRLDYRGVIRAALGCGLEGIEWGGDVHVPPGDMALAERVRAETAKSGLSVVSYGSYYRTGEQDDPAAEFAPVLDAAVCLCAPVIRVWAGDKASAECGAAYFDKAAADARIIADMAARHGVTVAFEYHPNTLTDTSASAISLLKAIGRGNVKTYWQADWRLSHAENLSALRAVLPYLENVHVFSWAARGKRLPLESRETEWRDFYREIAQCGKPPAMLLEFVKNDSEKQLKHDAEWLRGLVGGKGSNAGDRNGTGGSLSAHIGEI